MSLLQEKNFHIWTIEHPHEESFLRIPVPEFDLHSTSRKELEELIAHMRHMMITHRGVGLSANQIGLSIRMFVAQLPTHDGRGYTGKFYAIFNPRIATQSEKKDINQEGCLSIPHIYGDVIRSVSLTLTGYNKQLKPVTYSIKGYLARIMQHEIDHLNGILFTDSAHNIQTIS